MAVCSNGGNERYKNGFTGRAASVETVLPSNSVEIRACRQRSARSFDSADNVIYDGHVELCDFEKYGAERGGYTVLEIQGIPFSPRVR